MGFRLQATGYGPGAAASGRNKFGTWPSPTPEPEGWSLESEARISDSTGSVLPGVTVEVKSPVLIEQVRSAVTNGAGQYQVVDLRPGTYSVTFTLAGFNVLVREGIELTSGFTANVDVQLRVGAISETVTVSGASPLVDVQNTAANRVATREVIDTVPSARTFQGLGSRMSAGNRAKAI